MAIATATCTCATCGKTFEVRAQKQNRRDADAWETWAADHLDECTDCYKARRQRERDEERARAAAEARELGWPELTGTEKQVNWANTIREGIIRHFNDLLAELVENGGDKEGEDTVRGVRDWLLTSKTSASNWIDVRDYLNKTWDRAKYERAWIEEWKSAGAPADPTDAVEELRQAQAEEAAVQTVAPAGQTHPGAVVIDHSERVVTAAYRKDEDFRLLVKSLGFSWNPTARYWSKALTDRSGTARERAAELGNKLLAAGFAVRIADPEVRQAAVAGDYEPETFRWIDARDADFFITWARDDDFYAQAKRLPRARYSKPGILVPAAEWEEVQDFAHTHGFRFTPAAQELLDRQSGAVLVVEPAAPKEPVYDEHDPGEILQSPAEVLGDLIDDA